MKQEEADVESKDLSSLEGRQRLKTMKSGVEGAISKRGITEIIQYA